MREREDIKAMEEELDRMTTPEYRAPEQVDLWAPGGVLLGPKAPLYPQPTPSYPYM